MQHDYVLDNADGATFRADANAALGAIATSNSGTGAPATTYAYQVWADTTNGLMKQRNGTNTAWVVIGLLDDNFIDGQTEDTTPDGAADFVLTFDTSATGFKKVLLQNAARAFQGQLPFPATQNPSTDANTLDDYEEGTWTLIDGSGAGLSLTTSGRYIKIGRLVFVSANISIPSTASGTAMLFGGLPFTSSNDIASDMDGLHMVQQNGNASVYFPIPRNSATIAPRTGANGTIAWSVWGTGALFMTISGSYAAAA